MAAAAELPVIKHPIALPGFEVVDATVPEEAIRAYERDGVVWLRNVYSRDWIDLLGEGNHVKVVKTIDGFSQALIVLLLNQNLHCDKKDWQ